MQFSKQNHTHVNKVGHNSEFLFGVCWWIWKTNIYYQKLLKWANKKQNNFDIYKASFFFFLRNPPGDIIILHLCTKHLDDMIYSSWDAERDKLKLVFLGHFFPFYPLKNPKNQNFENKKKIAGDIIILHVYQKSQLYDVRFLRYRVRQTGFFVILGYFCPFTPPPNNPENQNFEKMRKIPGDIILHICTINENHYDVWFLRYGAQQTKFVVFLGHFLPLATRKIIILKKWKKILEI